MVHSQDTHAGALTTAKTTRPRNWGSDAAACIVMGCHTGNGQESRHITSILDTEVGTSAASTARHAVAGLQNHKEDKGIIAFQHK